MANPRCLAYEDSNGREEDPLYELTPPVYIHTGGDLGFVQGRFIREGNLRTLFLPSGY